MTSVRSVLYAVLSLVFLVTAGVFSFIRLEGKSFMDALWLTVVSITTVGFGDVVPTTTAGRIITMFLIVGGVSLLTYVLSTVFIAVLEGHLSDIWGKRKMIKEISKLSGHIVLCGAGRVGMEVIAELIEENQQFVVIEKDPAILELLRSEGRALFIAGDATEDKVLDLARLPHAIGVISTLADDSENLMITIASKDFNPKARVVARANRPESIVRLKRAGADTVVCPSAIAGNRMALAALKPASVAFVQSLVEERSIDLNLEELILNKKSFLVGKGLKDALIRLKYGVMVLAIRRGEENIINPDSSEKFRAGDLLILCGSANDLSVLEKVVAGE